MFSVVEARDKQRGIPQVVERWGDPESSKCVMAVSMIDRNSQPVCIDKKFSFLFFCSEHVYSFEYIFRSVPCLSSNLDEYREMYNKIHSLPDYHITLLVFYLFVRRFPFSLTIRNTILIFSLSFLVLQLLAVARKNNEVSCFKVYSSVVCSGKGFIFKVSY